MPERTRLFLVNGDYDFAVYKFECIEQLSRAYCFKLLVSCDVVESQVLETTCVGALAYIRFVDEIFHTQDQHIYGVISRTELKRVHQDGKLVLFTVSLESTVGLLKLTKQSRIFQQQTTQQIVDTVLDRYGIEHVWQLSEEHKPREYCVQYNETDYRFLKRILSEDGMFFYYEHFSELDLPSEKLIITDNQRSFIQSPTNSLYTVSLFETVHETSNLKNVEVLQQVTSNACTLTEFDFYHPTVKVQFRATSKQEHNHQLEHFEHTVRSVETPLSKSQATLRLQQLQRKRSLVTFESSSVQLHPGMRIQIDHLILPHLSGLYSIIRVDHAMVSALNSDQGFAQPGQYKNRVTVVPAGVEVRSKRLRKSKAKLQTATVTGPDGEEIFTDEHARVKVQFHWDRSGRRNEQTSCWIRTQQHWCGSNFGLQFVPRVGMEVVVAFINDDPDNPMIVGATYNTTQNPAFTLPERKTVSGLRTQSTIGGSGFHEISFDDSLGQERMYIHAQRDQDTDVGHCQTIKVERDQTTTVGNDLTESVAQNRIQIVGATRTSNIIGNDVLQIIGDCEISVGGREVHTVSSDLQQNVGASLSSVVTENYGLQVHGHYAESVKCHRVETTEGNVSQFAYGHVLQSIDGNHILRANSHEGHFQGDYANTVQGTYRTSVLGTVGAIVQTEANYLVSANDSVTLEAKKGIRLTCGETVIDLRPDQLSIQSPCITLIGQERIDTQVHQTKTMFTSEQAVLQAPTIQLQSEQSTVELAKRHAVIDAYETTIRGHHSSLQLDQLATLRGKKVHLATLQSGGLTQTPAPNEYATDWIDIVLVDQDNVPQPGVVYVVETALGYQYTGLLDKSGKAHVLIDPGPCMVSFPEIDKHLWKVKS